MLSAPVRPAPAAGRCPARSCTWRGRACRSPGRGRAARRRSSRLPGRLLDHGGVDLRPYQIRRERQLLRTGGPQLIGDGRDRAVLVERRRHHRHGETRGEQHAGDPGRLHGLLTAHRAQDDAVRGSRHGEQASAVGAGQPGLRQTYVQRLGEQRVRAQHIGEVGRDPAVHHRLADPAQQRAVRTGEQRHHDGDGAVGLLDIHPGGLGLLVTGGALLGGMGQDGLKRGELRVVPVEVPDPRVEAGELGAGDAHDLLGEAARGGRGRARNREDERGRALGSRQRLGSAMPPGLARSRHSYWQAGRGPSGGAHGDACYWFPGLPCSGRVQVSGIRPVLSDELRPLQPLFGVTTYNIDSSLGRVSEPRASSVAICTDPRAVRPPPRPAWHAAVAASTPPPAVRRGRHPS